MSSSERTDESMTDPKQAYMVQGEGDVEAGAAGADMASEAGGGASREEVARAMSPHGGGEPDMAAESSGRVDGVKEDEGWRSYESVFTNRKAGMDDVDRDWVKKVVYENSKNSPHFRNEQRKAEQGEQAASAPAHLNIDLDWAKGKAKGLVAELSGERDMSRAARLLLKPPPGVEPTWHPSQAQSSQHGRRARGAKRGAGALPARLRPRRSY